MEKINDLFDQEIIRVNDSFPSVYTKDDVIHLLSTLRTQTLYEAAELKSTSTISEKLFTEFQVKVRDEMEEYLNMNDHNLVVFDSAEFNLNYNNVVELERVDINVDDISEKLDDVMLKYIEKVFGNLLILDQQ
jgi:hypothetical protein